MIMNKIPRRRVVACFNDKCPYKTATMYVLQSLRLNDGVLPTTLCQCNIR